MGSTSTRILFVVIDLAGGTATFCRSLAKGLRRFCAGEFSTSLLLMRDRGVTEEDRELFDSIRATGGSVSTNWRRLYETGLEIFRLRRAIRETEPDLILAVGNYACLLAPTVSGDRPVVLTVHTHTSTQLREVRFGGLIARLIRWRFPRSLVIAPATGVAEDLQRNFGVQRTCVIPHGIDAEPILAKAEEPIADLPASEPYFIAAGRLCAQKDYPTMLRAYAGARQKGLSEHLVILGDGNDRAALESLARELGIWETTHFLGQRSNPFPYMKRARALVLSSVWEAFGLVLLEAMTLGVPCIAADCPAGPGEILGNGRHGLLVPPGDPGALAEAMLKLSSSPQLQADLRRQSLLRAEELSLSAMAGAYRELFLGARRQEVLA